MRLARYNFISVFLAAFLLSCAQLGSIEGGAKDVSAPRMVKSTVKNGSTNFRERTIEWQFDEYFQLNNPQTTISITPNHTRIKASASGKKVQIEFLDSLQANTTYQLLLNGTIKDINEGNDSLMVFVFSTGNTLDSASFRTTIVDAFTSQPIKKAFVGLFDSLTESPKYLQKTNEMGKVVFSYIKPGNYSVLCWEDQNANGEYDSTERVAFREDKLFIDDSIQDSIPLRLAKPEFASKIQSASFIEPGLVGVKGNDLSLQDKFHFDTIQSLEENQFIRVEKDSVLLPFNSIKTPRTTLFITKENGATDSIKLSTNLDEPTALKLKNKSTWVKSNDTFDFETTDFIDRFDSQKISALDKTSKDTIQVEKIVIIGNQLKITLSKNESKEIDFIFEKDAISGKTGLKSNRFKASISRFSERELGVLQVNVALFHETDLIQLIFNNNIVASKKKGELSQLNFEDLLPGEYSFRVIRDTNNNLRWDGWNLANKMPPEKVMWFTQPTKVRANWEVKTDLIPKNE